MAKYLRLNMDDKAAICRAGKALSSPVRLEILKLLFDESLYIGEMAKRLGIPASSAAMHAKILKEAGLISFEEKPGTRGGQKICHRSVDVLTVTTANPEQNVHRFHTESLPVGAYSEISVSPTCGLADAEGIIGEDDQPFSFYIPERMRAGILWSSSGYVVYNFANLLPNGQHADRLILTLEICSEAANYREDWKSDITFKICGLEGGTWTSPGDFGARRGKLNPESWTDGATQYGMLVTVSIDRSGFYINNKKCSDLTIDQLNLKERTCIPIWIGNKEDARYKGGFNIFGKEFGDFEQDINLSIEYGDREGEAS